MFSSYFLFINSWESHWSKASVWDVYIFLNSGFLFLSSSWLLVLFCWLLLWKTFWALSKKVLYKKCTYLLTYLIQIKSIDFLIISHIAWLVHISLTTFQNSPSEDVINRLSLKTYLVLTCINIGLIVMTPQSKCCTIYFCFSWFDFFFNPKSQLQVMWTDSECKEAERKPDDGVGGKERRGWGKGEGERLS